MTAPDFVLVLFVHLFTKYLILMNTITNTNCDRSYFLLHLESVAINLNKSQLML